MKYLSYILCFLFASQLQAQSLSLGAGAHYTSNGIHLLYSGNKSLDAPWQWNAGIRVTINTYTWMNNYDDHVVYQTGYANTFAEHFGLLLNGSRKLFGGKHRWRLDATIGGFYVRQSKKNKTYTHGNSLRLEGVMNYPARSNFEFGIGFQFAYKIKYNIQFYAYGRLGVHFYNKFMHIEKGIIEYPDGNTGDLVAFDFSSKISMVGFEGIPNLGLGIRYQFQKKK